MPVKPQLPLIIRRCLPSPLAWSLAHMLQQAQPKHISNKKAKNKTPSGIHLKACYANNTATWRSWPYRL
jgi:hypothetical protein